MARVRNPENRGAILQAAVDEIALAGLGAPTAKIAARAGIATGTLFTYFASKEELLNELYLALKDEIYGRVNPDFPYKAALKVRAWHIWSICLDWAIESPEKRKVSVLLNVSNLLTPETRVKAAEGREAMDLTLDELQSRRAMSDLPKGFVSSLMSSLLETTMDFIAKHPRRRKELREQGFEVFWKAVQ